MDRKTYEQYLIKNNRPTKGRFTCSNCNKPKAAFELVEVEDGDGVDGPFVCGFCLRNVERALQVQPEEIVDWVDVRAIRSMILSRTDWVTGEDVPQKHKDKLLPLRELLRSITDDYETPRAAIDQLNKFEKEYSI